MMKNLLKTILIVITLFLPILSFSSVYAGDEDSGTTASSSTTTDDSHQDSGLSPSSGEKTDCPTFFGIKAWYCNLDLDKIDNEDELKGSIVIIILNIIDGAFVIAGYLLLGFIIYGGFKYMISSGDPGKIASGKKTITNAIIGITIVALSYVIINTIRIALLGETGAFDNCLRDNCVLPGTLIGNTLTWVFSIAGVVALIFLVYGGISYITSNGDSGKVQKAKQIITYAIIGLAIIALAFVITNFVINTINENSQVTGSSLLPEEPHETTIS